MQITISRTGGSIQLQGTAYTIDITDLLTSTVHLVQLCSVWLACAAGFSYVELVQRQSHRYALVSLPGGLDYYSR